MGFEWKILETKLFLDEMLTIFVPKIYLMTLKEAFSLLITQPLWYKNSEYIRQQAVRDKRLFLAGRSIPEERMRHYLKTAGWEQTQEEQWEKDGK